MQDVCLHVSARLESNDSGLIYMTFWKGAVRRQRKTDCLDCAFFPATTALFTVLLQKLARQPFAPDSSTPRSPVSADRQAGPSCLFPAASRQAECFRPRREPGSRHC